MINNKINKWNPIHDIPNQLYLNSLRDEANVLTVLLSNVDTDRDISIVFDGVISYQSVIETCSLEQLEKYPILSSEWPLFWTEESNYIDRLVAQSFGMYEKKELIHYIITHGNGIINIVCFSKPLVTWVDQ